MKQIRASVIINSATGKIASAMLQEREYFTADGYTHWKDVRPLAVNPDGTITLFAAEPAHIEYSTTEHSTVDITRKDKL